MIYFRRSGKEVEKRVKQRNRQTDPQDLRVVATNCPREDKSLGSLYILLVLLKIEYLPTKIKEKVIDIVFDKVVTSSFNPRKMSLCST